VNGGELPEADSDGEFTSEDKDEGDGAYISGSDSGDDELRVETGHAIKSKFSSSSPALPSADGTPDSKTDGDQKLSDEYAVILCCNRHRLSSIFISTGNRLRSENFSRSLKNSN